MNTLKVVALDNRVNEFLNVEPSVSFGSMGALCKHCHMPVSAKEYIAVSWVDPTYGYHHVVGYLTDKHKCKK